MGSEVLRLECIAGGVWELQKLVCFSLMDTPLPSFFHKEIREASNDLELRNGFFSSNNNNQKIIMNQTSSISNVRIPLYNKKGVEVNICYSKGDAFLEISNSSDFPRVVSLANVWAETRELAPTIVNMGAHCLRKLNWSLSDHPRIRKIEVKVCENVEETMRRMNQD